MTKEEIIAAIKECAEKLGRAPSYPELRAHFRVNDKTIRRHFGKYKWALDECGLEPFGAGYEIPMEKLFRDWAGIIRKTGQIPSQNVYEAMSQFSLNPLMNRYRSWLNVPLGLLQYAESNGLSVEFGDVLDAVRGQFKKRAEMAPISVPAGLPIYKAPVLKDRPMYGPPMMPASLACGPVNEMGVVYLFGLLASKLGFVVTRIQTEFPDCGSAAASGRGTLAKNTHRV